MRGFHDPLKIRPSSLLILFGWSLPDTPIHTAGLGREDFDVLDMYALVMVQPRPICQAVQVGCASSASSHLACEINQCVRHKLGRTHRGCCTYLESSVPGRTKLESCRVAGQHWAVCHMGKWRESDRSGSVIGHTDPRRWVDSTSTSGCTVLRKSNSWKISLSQKARCTGETRMDPLLGGW
jgi:hypothetical protein